jgi:ankyrin repeat protein
VRLLVDADAELDALNGDHSNPLHTAAQNGHPTTCEILLDAGAQIDVKRSDSGSTPLITAAMSNRSNVVRLLIERGAALESQCPNGNTALGFAVDKGWKESAQVRQRSFVSYFTPIECKKRSFYPDRLGTNIRKQKVDPKRTRFRFLA